VVLLSVNLLIFSRFMVPGQLPDFENMPAGTFDRSGFFKVQGKPDLKIYP